MSSQQVNHDVIHRHIFQRVNSTGEQVKNDLPNFLRHAFKHESWKHFSDANGKTFETLGEWLVYTFPNGCNMGRDQFSITYDDALQLCRGKKGHSDVYDILLANRPKKRQGQRTDLVDNVNEVNGKPLPKKPTGNSRQYLEERLQRDFPKIYDEYRRGLYRSARAAAIAAGFVVDGHDALKRLKSDWKRANAQQRRAFKAWLKTKEAK